MIKQFFYSTSRTLGRIFAYVVLGFILYFIVSIMHVKAEDFSNTQYLQYWYYTNTDTNVYQGNGLPSTLLNDRVNRIQFLYNNYTYSPNYLYDITFKVYYNYYDSVSGNPLDLNQWVDSCSIYTGSGAQYTCYLTKNREYISITINNMVGTSQNNLWLNWYSNYNNRVATFTTRYVLTINRKDNPNVTSQDISNQTQDIINNNNNNTTIINNNIDDLNSDIMSESDADYSPLIDIQNLMPTNTPITNLIGMPITLLSAYFDNLNGTCQPWTINTGSLLGSHTWTLPCINLARRLGADVWSWNGYSLWQLIDIMGVIFMIYNIALLMINAYNDLASLDDTYAVMTQHRPYRLEGK